MKTLILILVLFISPLFAKEFDGLFGIKIGQELNLEILDKTSDTYEPIIGFDFNFLMDEVINNLKTKDEKINQLEARKSSLRKRDWYYLVLPKTPNKMFTKYGVYISPLSKKIIDILGLGDMNDTKCKESRKLIFDFIIDKYISSYEIKFSTFNDKTLNLYKKGIINEENNETKVSGEIEVTDLKPVSNPNNAIKIEINCDGYKITMSAKDNNYFRSILMNEKAMIAEMISLEIEKLIKEDLDTVGF